MPSTIVSKNPVEIAQLPSLSDELQDKIDRIDVLEDNLEKERNRLQKSLKDLSDLREELEIAQKRLKLSQQEH